MRMLFALLILLAAVCVQAQSPFTIKGRVVQEKNGEPIAGASVFISNSTKGTITKPDGSFELQDVPAGNHDLVVSSIGYSTLVYAYTAAQLPLKLEVQLQPRASELAEVVVEPDEAQGWQKWGKFFIENFIGTSENADQCMLLNPKVLRFKRSKKNNTLTVIADEPLIIENRALGYKIKYQLEEFSYAFSDKFLVYMGYAFFEDLPASNRRTKIWAAARETAYYGSIKHFMKSLYDNHLISEGFEVRRLIKEENTEKTRIRGILRARLEAQRAKGHIPVIDFGDSSKYYNRILSQPDEHERIQPALLTADSLLAATDAAEKTLFFTDYLHISYKNEVEEEGYMRSFFQGRSGGPQRSTIFLPNLTPIAIDSSGNFAPVLGMICYGYWSWSEKMANILPLDYKK